MPFKPIDVETEINKKLATNPEFKEAWENSRNEYNSLHDDSDKANQTLQDPKLND